MAVRPRKKSENGSSRLDVNDWVNAALDLLGTHGVDAVSIVPLAKRLNVTKGSFYWHFEDRSALLTAMLRAWRKRATLAIIERLDKSEVRPEQLLHRLIELPFSSARSARGASVELAIRLWAKRDSEAAAAIEEVDQHRLAYLSSNLRNLGLDAETAVARAYIVYSYILAESMLPGMRDADLVGRCESFLLRTD
jgi:AcrR family transcriptional regulator